MKKKILSLIFVLLFMLSLSVPSLAAIQASYYFSATDCRAYAKDDCEILIEFDIDATHTMLEVGASEVYIYEEQSDGSFDVVYTFTSDEYYSQMMDTNSAFGEGEVSYYGIPGLQYYALCALYARDADGAEGRYYTTIMVTCRN